MSMLQERIIDSFLDSIELVMAIPLLRCCPGLGLFTAAPGPRSPLYHWINEPARETSSLHHPITKHRMFRKHVNALAFHLLTDTLAKRPHDRLKARLPQLLRKRLLIVNRLMPFHEHRVQAWHVSS